MNDTPQNLKGCKEMPESFVDLEGNAVDAYAVIAEAFNVSGIGTQKAWNELEDDQRRGWITGVVASRNLRTPDVQEPNEEAPADDGGSSEKGPSRHPTEELVDFMRYFEGIVSSDDLRLNPFLNNILQNYRSTRPALMERHDRVKARAERRGI